MLPLSRSLSLSPPRGHRVLLTSPRVTPTCKTHTQTTPLLVATTPPPREQAEDLLNVWWMLYIVYPTCGVVGLAISLLTFFRCRYGYFPCCKVQCERRGWCVCGRESKRALHLFSSSIFAICFRHLFSGAAGARGWRRRGHVYAGNPRSSAPCPQTPTPPTLNSSNF